MENLVTEKKRRNVYTKYKHIKKLAPLSCACSFSFIWNWNQDRTRQIKFRFCFLCHVFEHKKWNEILAQIPERNPFTQIVLTFIHAKTKTVKQNWGWHRDLKLERLIIVANSTNTWRTQLFWLCDEKMWNGVVYLAANWSTLYVLRDWLKSLTH